MSLVADAAAQPQRAARRVSRRRHHPVAVHLMQCAAGILLPVLLIVALMLIDAARLWREDSLHDARVIAHHLNATIELELGKSIAVGQTMATALALDVDNHAAFDAQARDVAARLGVNVVARDTTGQQIVNTSVPAGSALPVSNENILALDRRAAETKAPVVSGLVTGTVRRLPNVNADIPVFKGSELAGFISVATPPDRFAAILTEGLPEGWIAGVVGRDGRLIARSVDQERYIGTVNPEFLRIATEMEGVWNGATRDGLAITGVYIRSPLSGWIVSVAVPETMLGAPARQAMGLLGGLAAAALLLSSYFGWRLARRIALPMRELVARARELGEGGTFVEQRSSIDEINAVTAALRTASLELERRATAEKLAADAVRANEERLQLVQETAGIGTIDWDIPANRAVCSARYYEMFAMARGAPVGIANFLRQVHPSDRERVKQLHDRLMERGGAFQDEFRVVTPDGEERWIHTSGRLDRGQLAHGGDGPVRLLAATIDITATKRNEQALLTSEARFRGIFENAAVGMALISLQGTYLLVNQRMCDIVGYSREELLSRTIGDVTFPDDLEADRAQGRRILAGEIATFRSEKRYVRKNGETIWCGLTVSLQVDQTGAPEYFIAVVRDITDRRRAQAELQERLREIEALYDNAPVGLTVLDADRRILRMNQALAEMNGLSAERNTGRFAWDVVPMLRATLDPKVDEVLATGQTADAEFSGEIAGAPGETRYWHEKIYPIRRPDGGVTAAGVVVEDVTERKRSEEHLRFLLRELSHRSKNLLAVIQAMAGQTAKSAESVTDFRKRFGERLMGMAASHDLLVNRNWFGASVEELVRGQLAPFIDARDPRLVVRGPDVDLKSEATEALGLALHELATNSLKYGAMSGQTGKVEIGWEVYDPGDPGAPGGGRRFRMEWIEQAGFPVSRPTHKGFGRMVIEHTVEVTLGGKVTLEFPPDGLRWRIDAPATCLAPSGRGMAA